MASFSFPLFGKSALEDFYKAYKQGLYLSALKSLEKVSFKKMKPGEHAFYRGLCLSRLQRFSEASLALRLSLNQAGHKFEGLEYEYAQVNYALKDYPESKRAFLWVVDYHKDLTSNAFYYQGYIGESHKDYSAALSYYKKMVPLKGPLLPVALSHMADIYVERIPQDKEKVKSYLEEVVFPTIEMAQNASPDQELMEKLKNQKQELKERYDLDPLKMANGKRLSEESFDGQVRQTMQYDSNIILEADEVTAKAAHQDTTTFLTDLSFKKVYPLYQRFQLIPKWHGTFNYNATNRVDAIKNNDAYTLNPKFEGRFEHSVGEAQATTLLKIEYNYSAKRQAPKGFSYYGRTYVISLGEKIKGTFLGGGPLLTLGLSDFLGRAAASKAQTTTLSLSNSYALKDKKMFLIYVAYAVNKTPKAPSNAQNSLTLRGDYMVSDLFPKWNFQGSLTLTLTDTKAQKAVRGMEKMLSPAVSLVHPLTQKIDVTFQYNYTKNISKAKSTYAYTKHVVGAELGFNF